MESLPTKIHPSWYPIITDCFSIELKKKILSKALYSPSKELIFNVFSTPLEEVKVVILGDSHATKKESIGLAFATSLESSKSTSLKIIEKEVGKELPNDLSTWVKQGVLLLNISLTTNTEQPEIHLKNWKPFMELLIQNLSNYNKNIVWMLWGKKAAEFEQYIHKDSCTLVTGHPITEVYNPGNGSFLGCNHFNKTNIIIKPLKINW